MNPIYIFIIIGLVSFFYGLRGWCLRDHPKKKKHKP